MSIQSCEMKALVLNKENQFPGLNEVKMPEVESDFSLIKVQAAALNRRDYWICKGQYPGIEFPVILGSDVCGELDGKDVIVNPGFEWGSDERFQSKSFHILGLPTNGGLAEYVSVPTTHVYEKPSHLSREQAAALPLAGVTAYRSLFARAGAVAGESVLISGVGGGVASLAMRFAVAKGCKVFVTSGQDWKLKKAVDGGAVTGVNYKNEEWLKLLKSQSGGFDVIVDSAGGPNFKDLVKLLRPGGRIVFYGGSLGKIDGLSPQVMFWKQLSLLGSTMGSPKDFENMLQFVTQHEIVPDVDQVYSFEQADLAFNALEKNDQFGKLVLTP